MIAIADGGCYPFYLLRLYGSTFYGSTVLTTAVRFRQRDRLRQAGSSQAVRLKSGSVMMEALERTFVHRPIRI